MRGKVTRLKKYMNMCIVWQWNQTSVFIFNFTGTIREYRKDLQALNLVGPLRSNLEIDPLAVLQLDNKLLMTSKWDFCTRKRVTHWGPNTGQVQYSNGKSVSGWRMFDIKPCLIYRTGIDTVFRTLPRSKKFEVKIVVSSG